MYLNILNIKNLVRATQGVYKGPTNSDKFKAQQLDYFNAPFNSSFVLTFTHQFEDI